MPEAKRGFGALPCILCGQEATITLDLDDCAVFRCPECVNDFSADDVRDHAAKWARVIAWIETAPKAE